MGIHHARFLAISVSATSSAWAVAELLECAISKRQRMPADINAMPSHITPPRSRPGKHPQPDQHCAVGQQAES